MATKYTLTVRGIGVGVEVHINGLPLLTLAQGGNVPGAKINHLVVPGQNEVSLRVFLPTTRPQLRPDAQTMLHVFKDDQELFASDWSAIPTSPTLPPETIGTFEAGEAFGAWQWQSASPLTLPLADEPGLNSLLAQMHLALSNKDTGQVLELLSLKNKEMARAFGIELAQADTNQRAFFDDLFSAPDWAMEPLNLAGVKNILSAGQRCVRPLTQDDREPLRSKPDSDGAVFSLRLLAAHFDAGWTIVR